MTDITLYEAVITQANVAQSSVDTLGQTIFTADPNELGFEAQFDAIQTTIDSVKAWAEQKILEAQEAAELAVMTNFLSELKVVFDKYSASIMIGSNTTGWGMNYGEGEAATGFMLTATFEAVTSMKEISKAVIVSGDLV